MRRQQPSASVVPSLPAPGVAHAATARAPGATTPSTAPATSTTDHAPSTTTRQSNATDVTLSSPDDAGRDRVSGQLVESRRRRPSFSSLERQFSGGIAVVLLMSMVALALMKLLRDRAALAITDLPALPLAEPADELR